MRILKLNISDLTQGKDPVIIFYNQLNSQFNDLGLTVSNSYISKVCGFYSAEFPNRAFVTVSLRDSDVKYDFIYDRFNIENLIRDRGDLDSSERLEVLVENESEKIIEILSEKHNINYLPEDFWVDFGFIEFADSEKERFILEATFDSLWFTGKVNLDLSLEENALE